jgi:hypothetical protein
MGSSTIRAGKIYSEKDRLGELYPGEVRPPEVHPGREILEPPGVPGGAPLAENRELLLIGHGWSPFRMPIVMVARMPRVTPAG